MLHLFFTLPNLASNFIIFGWYHSRTRYYFLLKLITCSCMTRRMTNINNAGSKEAIIKKKFTNGGRKHQDIFKIQNEHEERHQE